MKEQNSVKILLVEDNAGDVLLIKRALKPFGGRFDLKVANDGEEAMGFLFQHDKLTPTQNIPDLVLLDLNLPKIDGRELLETIKYHPGLKHIPVIVLTSSAAPVDVNHAYQHHVNAYMKKPANISEFQQYMQSFGDFWLTTSKLPKPTNP